MRRIVKITLIVLASFILVGIIGSLVVKHLIEKELSALNLGEMNVSSGGVRVDLLRRTVSLHDVRLLTDVERRDADTAHRSPIQYIDATVERLTLRGVRLKGIREGIFNVDDLSIESPRGSLVTRPVPPDTMKKTPSLNFQSIGIQYIKLSNAALDWQRITTGHIDTLVYMISGLELTSKGATWIIGKTPSVESLQGTVANMQYTINKRDYILKINTLTWNSDASKFSVDSLKLLPQHPPNRFVQQSAAHSDYNEAVIAGLICYGIDFQKLLKEKTVQIDSLHIASGHFLSYKNRQLNYGQKVKPMIHEIIQNIPVAFEINTLSIENFDAAYEELAEYGSTPGRVTFDDIRAEIRGMTNRPQRADQTIEVYANAKLMNHSELRVTTFLPVDPVNDHFEVKATLLSTPFASLNPMIEPLARVALQGGRIERMDFAMAGNSTSARVDMTLRYNGLDIAIMRKRNGAWQERRGLSNLVNWVVVQDSNPDARGLHSVSETVHRDPHRSAFNYLWKGISAGVLETAETGAAKRLLKK